MLLRLPFVTLACLTLGCLQALPTRVPPQRVPPPRRGQQHVSYAPSHADDTILGMSVLSASHNASASVLDSSSMVALANSTVAGDMTLGNAYTYGDSVLNESGMHGSGSNYSAAKQALASISAALSPMGEGVGGQSRQMQGQGAVSRMGGRDQYSVPPPGFSNHSAEASVLKSAPAGLSFSRERLASGFGEDVGSKRMRESFAPEPSPLLASDRRNMSADMRGRPAQRRRVSQPTNTVKKIMDIIKDTSTSHTDAR